LAAKDRRHATTVDASSTTFFFFFFFFSSWLDSVGRPSPGGPFGTNPVGAASAVDDAVAAGATPQAEDCPQDDASLLRNRGYVGIIDVPSLVFAISAATSSR